MKKTVLITGTTSGIGKAAAEKFLAEGWNVVATARDHKKIALTGANLLKLDLDVTNQTTITKAVAKTIETFGTLDVLVNNAGYGLVGILEELTEEEIQKQFDTNVFGTIRCMQAVLPHMRKQANGIIINITSMGGRVTFPYYSAYHATKWALEGWAESAQYELEAVAVTLKIVEPGAIKTDFFTKGMQLKTTKIQDYASFEQMVSKRLTNPGSLGSSPVVVAETIYKAATDGRKKLRYTSGLDALILTQIKKFIPDWLWRWMIKFAMKL